MTKFLQIFLTPIMAFALFVPKPLGDCCKSNDAAEQKISKRSCCGSHSDQKAPEKPHKKGKCKGADCGDCMASCCIKLVVTIDASLNSTFQLNSTPVLISAYESPLEQTLRGVFHPPRA